MSFGDIGYWNSRLVRDWHKGHPADEARDLERFWDGRAAAFHQRTSERSSLEYAKVIVAFIRGKCQLRTADTFLDLGCGTGALAIPMAQHVLVVTACDISGEMLRHLGARAQKAGIQNIVTVHKRWMDTEPGRDVGSHDLVMSHRSLGVIACDRDGSPDFVGCIRKMNQLARRFVFIIPRAINLPDDDEFEALFPECRSGLTGRFYDLMTYNLIHALGYFPCLEYIRLEQEHTFPSIEDEVAALCRNFRFTRKGRENQLADYIRSRAQRRGQGYSMPTRARLKVLWWAKEP